MKLCPGSSPATDFVRLVVNLCLPLSIHGKGASSQVLFPSLWRYDGYLRFANHGLSTVHVRFQRSTSHAAPSIAFLRYIRRMTRKSMRRRRRRRSGDRLSCIGQA
jgi:hypothetical protein